MGEVSNYLRNYPRTMGEYWASSNEDFDKSNPSLGLRVLRSLNPLTGFGSAVGAMHKAASEGDIEGMAMAGLSAYPTLSTTRLSIPASEAARRMVFSRGISLPKAALSTAADVGYDDYLGQKDKR